MTRKILGAKLITSWLEIIIIVVVIVIIIF